MAKKRPGKKVVRDIRTRVKSLAVGGYSTWLEVIFPYPGVPIAFPEIEDCEAQLNRFLQSAETSPSGHYHYVSGADRSQVQRLLYEHRVLMEIRYAEYCKPVLAVSCVRFDDTRWGVDRPHLRRLSPNRLSEQHRREHRSKEQPLGPFLADMARDDGPLLKPATTEQLPEITDYCASRNLLIAARKAGSFEAFINQTVEKYLGYKFGAPDVNA